MVNPEHNHSQPLTDVLGTDAIQQSHLLQRCQHLILVQVVVLCMDDG